MARLSKKEVRYSIQEFYDQITQEAKQNAQAELEARAQESTPKVDLPSMIAMIYNKELTPETVTNDFVEKNADSVKIFIDMRIFMLRIAIDKLNKLFTEPFIGTDAEHNEALLKAKRVLIIFWKELMVFEIDLGKFISSSDENFMGLAYIMMNGLAEYEH